MGMRIFSSSSYEERYTQASIPTNQPNPYRWELIKCEQVGKALVVYIKYPDATSYEGNKILVYKDTTWTQLKAQKSIDPHFSANKSMISPFARFEPTIAGWNTAVAVAKML